MSFIYQKVLLLKGLQNTYLKNGFEKPDDEDFPEVKNNSSVFAHRWRFLYEKNKLKLLMSDTTEKLLVIGNSILTIILVSDNVYWVC